MKDFIKTFMKYLIIVSLIVLSLITLSLIYYFNPIIALIIIIIIASIVWTLIDLNE